MLTRACYFGLLLTAACGSDERTLSIEKADDGSLRVVLTAPTGYDFSHLSGSINDRPLTLLGSGPGRKGVLFSEAGSDASAVFALDAADAPTEAAITVKVRDGSDHFVLECDTFNTARAFSIATTADTLIRGGDIIKTSIDPVASDAVDGSLQVGVDTDPVCLGGDYAPCEGCVAMKAAPDLSWWCDDRPADGTTLAGQASAEIVVSPKVTRCEGPDLSCTAAIPAYEATGPVTLQF